MGSNFAVAPGNTNTVTGPDGVFTYSLYWADGVPWSDGALFRLISDDGSEQHDFAKGDGTPSGNCVAFAFPGALPGMKYRGLLVDGDITLSLFAKIDLCALQHSADPCSYLPFPNPRDQKTSAPSADPAPASAAPDSGGPPASSGAPASASPASSTSGGDASDGDSAPVDMTAVENAAGPLPSGPSSACPFA